jgi:hypothetical protein
MELSGTLANGDSFGPVYGFTGEDGCVTFGDLLPGNYTITELFPTSVNWETTGPTYYDFEIVSTLDGSTMSGGSYTFDFTNFCYGEADFGTKGFWHNKNGLDLITDEDIAYVNGLAPYAAPSTYFTYDEPFDGFWSGGLVPAAFNNDKISDGVAAGEGTPRAEISHFLTDSNATGDPREQLAQQLLAFIFNVRYWGAGSVYYDGAWHSTADLIDAAIDAWNSGTPSEQTAIKDILDSLNNNDSVPVIFTDACYFSYD